MNKEDYLNLCYKLCYYDKLYYIDNSPVVSDYQYDMDMKYLEKIEKENPLWKVSWSPTSRVGGDICKGFQVVSHKQPMLSIANAYTREDVKEFLNKMKKNFYFENNNFELELKIDGIAIALIYNKGVFSQAITRGDGFKGDDITSNIKTIKSLPLKLQGKSPDFLEIRGEVFLDKKNFFKLNQRQQTLGKPLFINPRNAAGGTLKLHDPKEVFARNLFLSCYSVVNGGELGITSHYEGLLKCIQWGFPVLSKPKLCVTEQDIFQYIDRIAKQRDTLTYDIDGVVIKVDDLRKQNFLGVTGKHYRWALAYKFSAKQEETKLKKITIQIGKTGILTPVAELGPVFISGSKVSRASLYNVEEIERKDIREGDIVVVEKGGDIIPKVVKVNLDLRLENNKVWKSPKHCPFCSSPVIKREGEVALRCGNILKCPGVALERLQFFVSKEGLDIRDCGRKVVEQLFKAEKIKQFSDFFRLKYEDLAELPGFKEKSIINLLQGIEKAKKVSMSRFITALSLPYVGRETAKILAQTIENMEELINISEEDLISIEGIGPTVASSIKEFLNNVVYRKEIEELLKVGVLVENKPQKTVENNPFLNKNVVFTGTLHGFTRDQAKSIVEERGGRVSNSVSSKIDFLVYGETTGKKLDLAREKGVILLSEEQFKKLI